MLRVGGTDEIGDRGIEGEGRRGEGERGRRRGLTVMLEFPKHLVGQMGSTRRQEFGLS